MHSLLALALLLVPLTPATGFAPGQESPAEPGVVADLSLQVVVGRRVLSELSLGVEIELVQAGTGLEIPIEGTQEIVVVDEYTTVRDGDEEGNGMLYSGTRDFVQWWVEMNDVLLDPELTGVRVAFEQDSEGSRVKLVDRRGSTDTINKLPSQVEGMGMWCSLPGQAEVGVPFEFAAEPLVWMLLDVEGELDGVEGTLTLASVDEQGLARLTGSLSARETEPEGFVNAYAGDVTVTVDTVAHLLRSLDWSGTVEVQSVEGGRDFSGGGTFESSLAVSSGKAADKALAKRPKYRMRVHPILDSPYEVELESHWFDQTDEQGWFCATSLDTDEELAYVDGYTFALGGQDFDDVVDGYRADVETGSTDVKVKSTTSGIGRGKVVEYTDGEGTRFLAHLIRVDDDVAFAFRMYGPVEAVEAHEKSMRAMLKSLDERD